jgi:hypothetical protein
LSPGSSLEAYIRQGDDVATVDAAKIADQKQKELANSLRVAEIKKASTVSHPINYLPSFLFLSLFFFFAMRKIFPTQSA